MSSFSPSIYNKMLAMAPKRQFKILALMNYFGPEPNGYKPTPGIDGMNLDLHYLEQNVIRDIQAVGVAVGVWFETVTEVENQKVYNLIFGLTGA